MQVKLFILVGLVSIISYTSCSKKNDDIVKPEVSIEGIWVGKFSYLSQPYDNQYSFRIKAGGILERLDANGTKTGEGTWTFYSNNTAIFGSYSMIPPASGSFSIIANFDKVTGELDGTWGYGTSDYDGGYWYMNKTN